jgi:predicted amidohydrolase
VATPQDRTIFTPSDQPEPGLKVALAQMAPVLGDRQRNLDIHLELIAAAKKEDANLIVFPELSLTGYFLRDIVPEIALAADAVELRELARAAAPAALVLGFVEESASHQFYNASLFAEGGHIRHIHRKVYLPTYGLFEEQRYFAAGERIQAFASEQFGRVGLLVCEDFWHLSAAAILQAEEIDLLICVANSPARGIDRPHIHTSETYERLARTYAELLGAAVVVCNRVGFEDGLCFWGGSRVVAPSGEILAEAPLLDPSMTFAHLDPGELRRQRLMTPLARDEQLLLTIEELSRIRRRRYGGDA